MQVQPYLFFDGRCEEAVEFYRRTLGAEVQMLMRNKESPDPQMCDPTNPEKVLHMSLRIGDTVLMGSDGMTNGGKPSFEGFSLSLTVANDAEAQRCFAALAEGGEVREPLAKTFFASSFGMLTDRFGVGWMVLVPAM